MNQVQKAEIFRALHSRSGVFILPNPWDAGSARILASMEFEALATTSTGLAHSLGVRDGTLARDRVLKHCREIVDATNLPVSADLENGFADRPEAVAETIRAAARTGIVGCSIEDHTNRRDDPIYDFALAVERIRAAVEAKAGLSHDFVLTARCENYLWGQKDLDDTIERLQAYERAGADVLYAPGLQDLHAIRAVCEAVTKPVNVVIETLAANLGLKELAAVGVKRISLGSALFLSAYGRIFEAATEMQENGTFEFTANAVDFCKMEAIFHAFDNREKSE